MKRVRRRRNRSWRGVYGFGVRDTGHTVPRIHQFRATRLHNLHTSFGETEQ